MKLKDFIQKTLENLPNEIKEIVFELGLDHDRDVNPLSQNRLKFTVKRREEGK